MCILVMFCGVWCGIDLRFELNIFIWILILGIEVCIFYFLVNGKILVYK